MNNHDCSRQGHQGCGGRFDNGPLRPTPAQAGMLLRRGWFGRLREGFVPNVEMFLDPWKVVGSLTFRHYAECRNEGLGKSWYLSEYFTTMCQMSK